MLSAKTRDTFSHNYHLVDPSPWPLLAAFSGLVTTVGGVLFFNKFVEGAFAVSCGIGMILIGMYCWWSDIIGEASFEGQHTERVITGLKYGVLLFIVSEVMFFVAFFWAFFDASMHPSVSIGGVWPPYGLGTLSAWKVPFLNTLILLTSGAAVTICHHSLINGNKKLGTYTLELTIFLAVIFTLYQVEEYLSAPYGISDSVFGSAFFMATGFHGFHVIVGTCFLLVCLFRLYKDQFTKEHHFGFEAAAWYWHFVDVVWLYLFISVYFWGS